MKPNDLEAVERRSNRFSDPEIAFRFRLALEQCAEALRAFQYEAFERPLAEARARRVAHEEVERVRRVEREKEYQAWKKRQKGIEG